MDLGYSIGFAGGVASLITLFVSAPSWRSRVVHAIYVLAITVLAGAYIAHQSRITELTSVEHEARVLFESADLSSDGSTRGFILASLSFMEKHKARFPDTYEHAKQLAVNSGVLASKQEMATERLYQSWKLADVGAAMRSLLQGLAGAPSK
jgi:hypothetical protein